jgi:antitoxin (DNA-binding transcriptional repressor) of toxin-antitoxin stability system
VREVREECAEYIITVDGEPAAELRPVEPQREAELQTAEWDRWLQSLDGLAARLAEAWPADKSGVEAISEQRRKPLYGDP